MPADRALPQYEDPGVVPSRGCPFGSEPSQVAAVVRDEYALFRGGPSELVGVGQSEAPRLVNGDRVGSPVAQETSEERANVFVERHAGRGYSGHASS